MFVIKSNNSEKNPYQIVIFYIKKYNKRRILTSNRKRDWEFHLKKIFILNSSFSLLSKLDGRKRIFARFKKLSKVFTMLHIHVDDNCHLSLKNGSLPSPVLN